MLDVPGPSRVMVFWATSPATRTSTLVPAAFFSATPKTVFEVARLARVALLTIGWFLTVSKPWTPAASALELDSPSGTTTTVHSVGMFSSLATRETTEPCKTSPRYDRPSSRLLVIVDFKMESRAHRRVAWPCTLDLDIEGNRGVP